MATEPKRTEDSDKVVSLREARRRQADAKAQAGKAASGHKAPEKKMPALLIFLAMLAMLVAYRFLAS